MRKSERDRSVTKRRVHFGEGDSVNSSQVLRLVGWFEIKSEAEETKIRTRIVGQGEEEKKTSKSSFWFPFQRKNKSAFICCEDDDDCDDDD